MARRKRDPKDGWEAGGIYARAHDKARSKIYDRRPLRDKYGEPIKNDRGKFTWVPIETIQEEEAEYKINFERYVRRFKYDYKYKSSNTVSEVAKPNPKDDIPCPYESAILAAQINNEQQEIRNENSTL